ncbi:MAG TPA: hypothetical protein VGB55_08975 [Tepidisphaeraceae bacterium]
MLLLLVGCDRNKPKMSTAYTGPTDPLDVVVANINARNARIDALWCAGGFSANLIDPQTKDITSGDGDLTMLYMPRRNLRLRGKVLTETVFDIGSNEDRYWLIIPNRADTMWWGYHRLLNQTGSNLLPVRPDLLTEVLAVGAIDTDLLKEPFPVMRFNNDQDAYMFTWQVQMPGRWAVQKEVWYDRKTLLPRLVLLFNPDGRIVCRAYLTQPMPVEGYDPALMVASNYSMYFPDTGSTFDIRLNDLARKRKNLPTASSFNFPGASAGVSKVIQVDK